MLTLADGRDFVGYALTMPAGFDDGDGPVTIDPSDFENLTKSINKGDFRLSASGSDTVDDQPLSQEGNAVTYGASNLEGNVSILRGIDPATGKPDAEDTAFTALGEKGTRVWLAHRVGPKATVPLSPGDTGWLYEAITDAAQEPQDRKGYIKNAIPLGMQTRRPFIVAAAPTVTEPEENSEP
ncbi:MAG: hypothetical protein LBH13_06615 [Cellulomonadaceae bacterium]|jgi:hypothetical protein|nr:hypothetical protein [Cellulomonadaceae bacterium]